MSGTTEPFVPFYRPSITDAEIAEVVDTLRSGWLTTGPKTRRLEEEFAAFVGSPNALAVNSATGALHVALAALGIGPGDEVITTPMTFVSTVTCIEHVGATPLLVDVEQDTLNLNPAAVEKALKTGGHSVRAVLPVHLYGHPCDMDPLLDLATTYDLRVVEDAAHALPARYRGRMVGTLGDLAAFSFYATKNMTTAEGGMLTGPPELLTEASTWSLHGISRHAWMRYSEAGSWHYDVIHPGFKYNMTDIQAALGIQQLRRLPDMQRRREAIVRRYNEAFAKLEQIDLPPCRSEVEHAWHLYVLRLNLARLTVDRDGFIEALRHRGIGCSVHFIPVHLHSYYRQRYGFQPEDFPIAFQEYQRIVSVPLFPGMADVEVDRVIDAVTRTALRYSKPTSESS